MSTNGVDTSVFEHVYSEFVSIRSSLTSVARLIHAIVPITETTTTQLALLRIALKPLVKQKSANMQALQHFKELVTTEEDFLDDEKLRTSILAGIEENISLYKLLLAFSQE